MPNERAWLLASARRSHARAWAKLRLGGEYGGRPYKLIPHGVDEQTGHLVTSNSFSVLRTLDPDGSYWERVLSCNSHHDGCPCVLAYRHERRTKRRKRRRRTCARKLAQVTWASLPKEVKTKHLSIDQCREFNISHRDVGRPAKENSLTANLRIMCVRFILLLRRRGAIGRLEYGFHIPKAKPALYSLLRSLSRKIRRAVLPIAGQWAPGNWQPNYRKDPVHSEFNYSDEEVDSDY